MINVISRSYNDLFTYNLFTRLLDNVDYEHEAYYLWTADIQVFKNFISDTTFLKPNIVIGIKDLLNLEVEYDFWADIATAGATLLAGVANKNADKNFIIFTSLENLKKELDSLGVKNIQVIPWGGDIVNQSDTYPAVLPVINKNFKSSETFISLTRHPRPHRLILLSYLFGTGYNNNGIVTYIGEGSSVTLPTDILDIVPWNFENHHTDSRQLMIDGYKKFHSNKPSETDNFYIYRRPNDNVTNFNQSLRSLYQNSFVEIVSESSFASPSYMLTEKTLNSIYGCNFPIILSGIGATAHLREIGFDLFDDVVDHSYDQIANPIDRIVSAVERNKRLLLDAEYAKQLWKSNLTRFENNVALAKNTMYNWYASRASKQFSQLTWK